MKKITVFLLHFIFVLFSHVSLASVVLLQDNRSVASSLNYLYGGQNSNATYSPQTPFSDWTAVGAISPYSSQYTLEESSVTTGAMSGSGVGAEGYYSDKTMGYSYQYSSYFSIRFRVDTAQNMQLNATLKAFANQCCDGTGLSLMSSQGTIIGALVQGVSSTAQGDSGITDYSGTGLLSLNKTVNLAPGEYVLSVGANYPYDSGKASESGSWSFTASFSDVPTVVPLPSAIWLFVSAFGFWIRRVCR